MRIALFKQGINIPTLFSNVKIRHWVLLALHPNSSNYVCTRGTGLTLVQHVETMGQMGPVHAVWGMVIIGSVIFPQIDVLTNMLANGIETMNLVECVNLSEVYFGIRLHAHRF